MQRNVGHLPVEIFALLRFGYGRNLEIRVVKCLAGINSMRDAVHDYEVNVEADWVFRCSSPMVNVWHRDGRVLSNVANSCNFSLDLVIREDIDPGNWKSEEDDPIVKYDLEVEIVGGAVAPGNLQAWDYLQACTCTQSLSHFGLNGNTCAQ